MSRFRRRWRSVARHVLLYKSLIQPPTLNHMKASHSKLTAGILAVGFLINGSVMAAAIVGGISFTGNYTANDPSSLLTSTLITFGEVRTTSTTGDFLTNVGDNELVTTPGILAINAAQIPQANTPIWDVKDFSLVLDTLVEQFNTKDSLVLYGTGTITGPSGFDATPGDWTATFNRAGSRSYATFSFSASSAAQNVPDGSASIALLGISLLGIEGIRRKLIFRKS